MADKRFIIKKDFVDLFQDPQLIKNGCITIERINIEWIAGDSGAWEHMDIVEDLCPQSKECNTGWDNWVYQHIGAFRGLLGGYFLKLSKKPDWQDYDDYIKFAKEIAVWKSKA